MTKLLSALHYDIRVAIKDDESRQAASWSSLHKYAYVGPWRTLRSSRLGAASKLALLEG